MEGRTSMHFKILIFFGTILSALFVLKEPSIGFVEPGRFIIKTKRAEDGVTIQNEKNLVAFVIKSPSGISQAIIERMGENWPETILIKLKLKGLENFCVTNGKDTLQAAVSSTGNPQKIRVWRDKDDAILLNSKSPNWIDIRILNNAGDSSDQIPLKDGTFEVKLPKALFKNNPKSITISWIDFYRN